ncbi:unnamed protein product [Linum trigynum]|uniref:Uncharacterized protein n=1 Tax=Linum trigynum TaxID=586398 RepID=A0AAV2GQM2_9ROSI
MERVAAKEGASTSAPAADDGKLRRSSDCKGRSLAATPTAAGKLRRRRKDQQGGRLLCAKGGTRLGDGKQREKEEKMNVASGV